MSQVHVATGDIVKVNHHRRQSECILGSIVLDIFLPKREAHFRQASFQVEIEDIVFIDVIDQSAIGGKARVGSCRPRH